MLLTITFVTNLLGFGAALWLGLYLVTRNQKNRVAWLTSLALWSVGGLFLNVLFALAPPPGPTASSGWLRVFFPFWNDLAAASGNSWLLGWSIGFAIVLWHHVTTLIRGGLNTWRRFRIAAGYIIAVVAVWLQLTSPWLSVRSGGSPLFLDTLQAGRYYLVFGLGIVLFSGWSFVNLYRSSINSKVRIVRRQLSALALATLIGAIAGPIAITGSMFSLPIPMVFISLPLILTVGIIGYSIAQYSALVRGRTIRRDFLHAASGALFVSVCFVIVSGAVSFTYKVSSIVYIVAVFLAVTTYSLFGVVQSILDKIIYGDEANEYQANLQRLTAFQGTEEDYQVQFQSSLDIMCASTRASFGLLVSFEGGSAIVAAGYRFSEALDDVFDAAAFQSDDYLHLPPDFYGRPLHSAAFLIPIYMEDKQVGAVVLGQPENGVRFSEQDVEIILDVSDVISDTFSIAEEASENARRVSEITWTKPSLEEVEGARVSVKDVESVLRNISDFAKLGDSPLARLKLTDSYLDSGEQHTHVDRGKAVYQLMRDVLEKLRPESKLEGITVPREWFSYIILHDAYMKDTPNRDIMARLYISEGTFNRTRRAALRTVARIIEELEINQ